MIAAGTPEEVARVPESYTGQYLRPLLFGQGENGDDAAPNGMGL